MWLKVLNEGRVKPDSPSNQVNNSDSDSLFHSKSCNATGIVKESREFIPLINGINRSLQEDLNVYDVARALKD